ncbi:MAG TPA: hypothetical protein PKB14_03715 [Rubrivivax sp.]|nr:hypothetical protein [Rubrivivax sp.]
MSPAWISASAPDAPRQRIGRCEVDLDVRRKVEPDPAGEPRCIRTVRNAGYMFVPDA